MIKKKSRIFIAGHNGMVGSAIKRKFELKGSNKILPVQKKKLNLLDQKKVFKFLKKNKINSVIICAARVGGIKANNDYKANFIYENLAIQNNLIHASMMNNIKNLIFLGSSCVYPKFCKQPIKEKYLLSNYLEKVLKFLLKKPVDLFVKQNHTYLWDSDLLHKGNLNKTNKSHTALVLRISHKPLYYEPTVKISEIINNSNLISNKQQVTFKDLSLVLFEICEIAKKKENFLDYFSDFRESTDKHFLKHISFSLSLLAQRFEGNFSSNLDLISFILSKENLVSLERFLIKFKDNSISEEIIRKFFNDENLSYQENLIVNKFKNKNLCDVQNQKIISWSD